LALPYLCVATMSTQRRLIGSFCVNFQVSIAELFRQDAFPPGMARIEQDGHRGIDRFTNNDPYDIAHFAVVRDCAYRTLIRLQYVETDSGFVRKKRASPASWPVRTYRRQCQERRIKW